MPTWDGDDGLPDVERAAHASCVHISCEHEACLRRYQYGGVAGAKKQQKKCGPIFQRWKKCFDEKLKEGKQEKLTEGAG